MLELWRVHGDALLELSLYRQWPPDVTLQQVEISRRPNCGRKRKSRSPILSPYIGRLPRPSRSNVPAWLLTKSFFRKYLGWSGGFRGRQAGGSRDRFSVGTGENTHGGPSGSAGRVLVMQLAPGTGVFCLVPHRTAASDCRRDRHSGAAFRVHRDGGGLACHRAVCGIRT